MTPKIEKKNVKKWMILFSGLFDRLAYLSQYFFPQEKLLEEKKTWDKVRLQKRIKQKTRSSERTRISYTFL